MKLNQELEELESILGSQVGNINFEWGWPILFMGAILLIISGLLPEEAENDEDIAPVNAEPISILKERLARGEITNEEYQEKLTLITEKRD